MPPSADGSRLSPEELRELLEDDLRQHLLSMLPGVGDERLEQLEQLVVRADTAVLGDRQFSVSELVDVLRAQVATASGRSEWIFSDEADQYGLMAAAWRMNVRRQTSMVILAYENGFHLELMPNARSAIEHAAILWALADAVRQGIADQFVAAVRANAQANTRGLVNALGSLDDATGNVFVDLMTATREGPLSESPLPKKQRLWGGQASELFAGIAQGPTLYVLYRWLSDHAHAGLGSAIPYFRRILQKGYMTRDPVSPELAELFAALSWACWAADEVLDEFLTEPALLEEQRDALKPFGFGG